MNNNRPVGDDFPKEIGEATLEVQKQPRVHSLRVFCRMAFTWRKLVPLAFGAFLLAGWLTYEQGRVTPLIHRTAVEFWNLALEAQDERGRDYVEAKAAMNTLLDKHLENLATRMPFKSFWTIYAGYAPEERLAPARQALSRGGSQDQAEQGIRAAAIIFRSYAEHLERFAPAKGVFASSMNKVTPENVKLLAQFSQEFDQELEGFAQIVTEFTEVKRQLPDLNDDEEELPKWFYSLRSNVVASAQTACQKSRLATGFLLTFWPEYYPVRKGDEIPHLSENLRELHQLMTEVGKQLEGADATLIEAYAQHVARRLRLVSALDADNTAAAIEALRGRSK